MSRHRHASEPIVRPKASTGIDGLDFILRGGFPREEMHLVQGGPGTGKTTLSLQFLLAGVRAGERGLYITLSQTKKELELIARSHGWSLEGVALHELSPDDLAEHVAAEQTVLHTAEVELGELTRELRRQIEQVEPQRIVFDSLGVIGIMAGSAMRYRREIMGLRQFLAGKGCTVLFVGEQPEVMGAEGGGSELQSLASSLVLLDQEAPDYGEVRRRVRVIKLRGVAFEGGHHNFRIHTGGLEVYPRLGVAESERYDEFVRLRSGIASLDELLGGGLERGTACLVIGPPGTGKSTLATVFARSAAKGGDKGAIFLFEERPETYAARSKAVGLDLQPLVESGVLLVRQLDPVQITPGEFAQRVREAVEEHGAKVVVIDSLTGYFNAMAITTQLVLQMHELLTYLSRRGVLTILVVAQEGFMSIGPKPVVDVSYLSDSIVITREFEAGGVLRRCLAAIKKRHGEHETTIRELFIRPGEVSIGDQPLRQFRHILGSEPERDE